MRATVPACNHNHTFKYAFTGEGGGEATLVEEEVAHDSAPWSSNVPHIEQRWVNMQSRPYGHPAGALLTRRHVPGFFCLFSGGFPSPPNFAGVGHRGLFPLPCAGP